MLIELILASLMNAVNLAMLIDETRRANNPMRELKTPRGSMGARDVPRVLRRQVLEGELGLRHGILAGRVLRSAAPALREHGDIWWPRRGPLAHDADRVDLTKNVGPHRSRQVHDLLHARPRRRLAPHARLLRRARDERVSINALGAPEGRPGGLAPCRRLEGVLGPLQRPLQTLLANKTNVTIKI